MDSVSVVIVCRNEEVHIAQCINSVVAAIEKAGGGEIAVVDSGSTDRTVEIARTFGVRVLLLSPASEMSASAGRFVGFHKTQGDLVMFVDGDTVIDSDWLCDAVPYFDQANVAGTMGYLDDFDARGQKLPYVGRRSTEVIVSPWLRGIGMYRRKAMDEVGTFNPYLTEEEEAELALRLRRHNWQLLNVPNKMGDHLRGGKSFDILLRRQRLRFVTIGRTLRYAVSAGNGKQFLFERCRPTVTFVLATLVLLAGTTFALLGHRVVEQVMLVILAVALVAVVIKKRTLSGPVLYFVGHILILFGLITGFFTSEVKDPCDYKIDVAEVSTISVGSELARV